MDSLDIIAQEIFSCTQCPLHQNTKNAVPGTGNPKARVVVVGEAPGANEDEQGKPFVGRAGQILTELLNTIEIKREDVFITNVVKHRPPNNREPQPKEVAACHAFLERQIAVIDPELIVVLGNHALEWFAGKQGISTMRGRIFHKELGGKTRKIFPTFHPAALIYNQALKPTAEKDFQRIKQELAQKGLSSF